MTTPKGTRQAELSQHLRVALPIQRHATRSSLRAPNSGIIDELNSGMHFMVVEKLKNADPKPIYERLAEKGG